MRRTDIVDVGAGELFQCLLHRGAVFSYDVGVVACHLQPEGFTIDVLVDNAAIESAEAAKGIAREEQRRSILAAIVRLPGRCERHHRFRPVDHRCQHEGQFDNSRFDGIAVFNLFEGCVETVEALYHLAGLFVSNEGDVGVVFLDECQRPAVVRLHVVDDEVIDGSVADDCMNVLDELGEKTHIDGIDECNHFVHNEVGIIGYTIG